MTSPGGSLTQQLQLVVDATTGAAETKFQRLTGVARETGEESTRSANSVRDAADRVAAARDRELAASGNLRVAEIRLNELREGGRARADQLAAAEEKVAAAQRNLQLATRNTQRATEDQTRAQVDAVTQTEETARSSGRLDGVMGNLKGSALGAAAAMGGAGLMNVLRGLSDGFASGARDAGLLATSMNASVGEAGAFLGLVGSLGLELNDLLEIQAEFAQKVQDNASELQNLGVQVDRNDDGTVNWANTLVSFMDKLQGVEDATERNRLGFLFLGEEGYKQMSRLVSSGMSVRDALAKIGTPFTEADVAAAAEYDAAMMELNLTSTRTQQQLGRALLPVLIGVMEGVGDLVDVAEEVPMPMALATAAAIALGLTGFNPTAAAGARVSAAIAIANRELLLFRVAAAEASLGTAALSAGFTAAQGAASRVSALAGGPLGLALIGLAGIYTAASSGQDAFRESAKKAAAEMETARTTTGVLGKSMDEMSRGLVEDAGHWERLAMAQRGYTDALQEEGGLPDWLADLAGKTSAYLPGLNGLLMDTDITARGAAGGIKDAAEELGAFGAQQETAQTTSKALNDLIAEGTTSGAEFAAKVREAAEAETAQSHTSDLAKAALEAYNATTKEAVQTQLDLFSAQLQQRDGLIGLQQTVWEARDAVDDLETPWNEVNEATNRVIGSALDYAGTAADAAVSVARANGTVVDSLTEARLRSDATIGALRESLNAPGLTDAARQQITDMITKLDEASKAGDIEAILTLTGADQTKGELDETTKDRESLVKVETRGGPAVVAYLDRVTAERLTLVRVESRNGPAVDEYLGRVAAERLSIIRVESRNGPAVDAYLDELASQTRVAWIDVRQRGAAAVRDAVGGLRGAPGALTAAGMAGGSPVTIGQLTVQVAADSGGRLTQQSLTEAGRQYVAAIGAYERRNGPGWRAGR